MINLDFLEKPKITEVQFFADHRGTVFCRSPRYSFFADHRGTVFADHRGTVFLQITGVQFFCRS